MCEKNGESAKHPQLPFLDSISLLRRPPMLGDAAEVQVLPNKVFFQFSQENFTFKVSLRRRFPLLLASESHIVATVGQTDVNSISVFEIENGIHTHYRRRSTEPNNDQLNTKLKIVLIMHSTVRPSAVFSSAVPLCLRLYIISMLTESVRSFVRSCFSWSTFRSICDLIFKYFSFAS